MFTKQQIDGNHTLFASQQDACNSLLSVIQDNPDVPWSGESLAALRETLTLTLQGVVVSLELASVLSDQVGQLQQRPGWRSGSSIRGEPSEN